jgi:hypothetical protein
MKTLFNLKYVLLLAFASLFIVACEKDDDDDDDNGNNTIVFDGTSYTIVDGLVEDYGEYDPIESGEYTHWNYDFSLLDVEFTQETEEGYTYWDAPESASFFAYAELFSPGTTSFQAGTFEFIEYDSATPENIDGKFFFNEAYMGIKVDGDETGFEATAGTVKVSGSGSNWTIEFDLTLEGGKTAKGSYSGTFKMEDESEDMLKKK